MKQKLIHCCVGVLISILFAGCNDLKQDKQQPQPVQVSDVELTFTALSLGVGAKQTLTATVLPADAENKTVSWKSADVSIATVTAAGEVTAEGAGETTITATADGGKTARCTVTVTAKTEQEQEQEQEPEPELSGTFPVTDIPEDVTAFFKKYLHPRSGSYPESGFNFGKLNTVSEEYFIINNMEEFKAVAPLSVELPVIDFEKYTLIIGQHWMSDPGFTLKGQAVNTESEEMVLSLVYKRIEGAYPTVPTVFYFWGLYPKLPQKSVILNIVKPLF